MFRFFIKKRKDPKKAIKELLNGFELPSFPQAVMNALKKMRDPDIPMREVAKEIEKDPGMHVMVLKCVNSAAFGLSRKVSNIVHAVNLLGRSRLESLILPLAVRDSLPKITMSCMDLKKFWYTSGFRASLARQLAEKLHPAEKDDSFTAALLQDIGIPILIKSKRETYCDTLNQWDENEGLSLPLLEKKLLGFDHQIVGGLMAEEWEFPEKLKNSILTHHETDPDLETPISAHLVSHIRFLNGLDIDEEIKFMKEICIDRHGFKEAFLDNIVKKAISEAEEMALLMK
ncbi:HD domain protein [Dissulfuribacter thermophilus]|uniref:HD domain protein n=1 Tax=Dissulfuribacter thermophilus TaxID=1156395 RepID=A0A1B9F3F9_9BACT|nr:HDOD domain-containing protein [Dissulfuribacter thermophilus]OCC14301.1 HD domain protein [Dissulfuribacter thermophilus]